MSRGGEARGTLFALLLLVMVGHESEHVAQIVQKDALGEQCPDHCRGLLGFVFDVEWIHFAYNASIFLLLIGLFAAYRLWEPRWRRERPVAWTTLAVGIFAIQGYHVVEHTAKLDQWLTNGHHAPTPGLLGKLLPWRGLTLVELHFTLNTVVLVCVLVGYLGLGLHRDAWAGGAALRRAAVALAAVAVLVVGPVSALAWATDPPTVRLAAGFHRGPLVLDRAQKLIGEPGATVQGGIVVKADDVTVRRITVVGGEYGIDVERAKYVVLEDVTVSGAALDGIHVRRSAVTIRDCRVVSPGGYTQGIDISFAIDMGMSLVEGCTIIGGREGIVTHSAMVAMRDNRVRATSLRGIAMTEMSMGEIEENHVADALGVGVYCGDYSECKIERNTIANTRADHASGDLSRMGYPIVAFYGAKASLTANRIVGSTLASRAFAHASIRRGR